MTSRPTITAGYALVTRWGSMPYCWTTREGRRLSIQRMTKAHLRNALRMYFRAADIEEMRLAFGMPDDVPDGYIDPPSPSVTILKHARSCSGLALLAEWERRGYVSDVWAKGDPAYERQISRIMDRMFGRRR